MKIQNTQMEFVSFDAKDIIVTSGEFTLAAGYTYKFTGLLDAQAKNAALTQYDGNTAIATWYFFDEDGNAQYPDKAAANVAIIKSNGKETTFGAPIGKDANATEITDKKWEKDIFKWVTDHLQGFAQ